MADAIVSVVLEQLTSPIFEETRQQVRLVTGVRKEIEKLTRNFRAIGAVLLDEEDKQVKDKAVGVWLDRLKEASYDVDDILDEWKTAILKLQIEGAEGAAVPKKVCFLLCSPRFCFKQVGLRHEIARKMKKMNEELDDIAREKDMFRLNTIDRSPEEPQRLKTPITTAYHNSSEVRGREEEKTKLLCWLLSECHQEGSGLQIISIVGVGGIGKTTLAQLAYNDDEITGKFEKKIWVCVSDPFDEIRIAKAIIEALEGKATKLVELQSLLDRIKGSIANKKFFLVLDDVWTEDERKWVPLFSSLNNGAHGSKIVVTTRNMKVARMMKFIDVINVGVLSEEESWSLFKQLAFRDWSLEDCEKLEKYGREIVKKCNGLPLAVKTIGSLLQFKKTSEQWKRISDSDMWELEELEEYVFRPLLLSYSDLPSKIKRCFLYCVIFSKDFNIEKRELIELWMAQSYLGLEQNEDLELIGEDYFNNLAMRSFFQEFENDEDDNIISCKMHDIVHEFALFLVKKDCFAMEINSREVAKLNPSYEKVHHLMLTINNDEVSFPLNKCGIQKLRSLVVEVGYGCLNLSMQNELFHSNLFQQLTCLRLLVIYKSVIQNIPKEIGKLIHLRYLSLRNLEIKELPDTLCDLFNLQILSLIACDVLENLPQGMGRLFNLRHLILEENRSLEYLPKGVERLTNLRTLRRLNVGGGREVCRLDCLKNLNHLRGQLELTGLKNVLDEGEAKNAQLKNKENIVGLVLNFRELTEASSNKDEAILEALESPPYLKDLRINYYRGIAFPNWVVSLAHLQQIKINYALECEYLPALGKLPLLETLEIRRINRLKRVGNEFLGVENSSDTSSSSSSPPPIAFPLLKNLWFYNIPEWEEWEYENRKDIIIMPSLSQLTIIWCPKLKVLPDHLLHSTLLKRIEINEAFKCEYLPALGKLPLLETLEIQGMNSLKRVGNEFLGVENSSDTSSSSSSPVIAFPKLKHLMFSYIREWEEWEYENRKDIIIMPSLSKLTIESCPKLKALPNHLLNSTSLKQIEIDEAFKCEYLPALGKLPLLETLKIRWMNSLKRVGNEFLGVENSSDTSSSSSSSPVIAFPKLKHLLFSYIREWEEWEYENRKDIIIMPSLSELTIESCPKLKALPDHLLHSASLKRIKISKSFKCEYLPALGKLPLLETLEIQWMKSLKRVGNEFLGVENSSDTSSSSSSPVIAFPKLKHLVFSNIREWEEWEYENRKDIIIMPSLSELRISDCFKLKALPNHLLHSTSLEKLYICDCSLLENWCQTKGIQFTGFY